jgi:acetyl-CoA carboxylase biotin carboxyl carrier protein
LRAIIARTRKSGYVIDDQEMALITDAELRQIIALIEALDHSGFDSLQLDVGKFRLSLGRGAAQEPRTREAVTAPVVDESAPTVAAPSSATLAASSAAAAIATAGTEGLVDVRARIMGLFYARPDPSSPPFVSVGTPVREGATLGLIEVMKVFNAIPAVAGGVIAEVCVGDGATVEIGQTLFRIDPTRHG